MECRRGNIAGYIKFFLQCIIDQCNSYIFKIEKIKEIYRQDMKKGYRYQRIYEIFVGNVEYL